MTVPHDGNVEAEDKFASLNSIIFTTSLLALIAIGYRINTHRLKYIPESGAAMALGFVVGIVVRVFQLTEEEQLLNFKGEFFFFVLLPPIIFEAGLSLETQMFVDNLGAILSFAVFGTIVSTWVVSSSLLWAAETGWIGLTKTPQLGIQCHLFGALISATDPVATIALFGGTRYRTDPLLHSLINGESVLNDAVAIVLFSTLSSHMDEKDPQLISAAILGHFFLVSVGSLAIGLVAGAVCSWCFCHSRLLSHFPNYEISAMFLGAYLTFAFAQLIGLSGIVALFFFGIVLAQYNWYNLSEHSKVAAKVGFGTLSKLAESCVFMYLGGVAALSIGRFHWHMGLVFYSIIIITVARAAHIFPFAALLNLGRYRKIDRRMKFVMWISGLRGAIAFALSLRIPCISGQAMMRGSAECRNSDLLVTTTISIVVLTTLVVGAAMEHVMTALGVLEPTQTGGVENTSESAGSLSIPLATQGSNDERYNQNKSGGMGSVNMTPNMPAIDHEAGHSAIEHSNGPEAHISNARSLFNARGQLYQAFARFDLNVLQPVLGGPCCARNWTPNSTNDTVELPTFQGFVPPSEEDAPAWSRSVIFE